MNNLESKFNNIVSEAKDTSRPTRSDTQTMGSYVYGAPCWKMELEDGSLLLRNAIDAANYQTINSFKGFMVDLGNLSIEIDEVAMVAVIRPSKDAINVQDEEVTESWMVLNNSPAVDEENTDG